MQTLLPPLHTSTKATTSNLRRMLQLANKFMWVAWQRHEFPLKIARFTYAPFHNAIVNRADRNIFVLTTTKKKCNFVAMWRHRYLKFYITVIIITFIVLASSYYISISFLEFVSRECVERNNSRSCRHRYVHTHMHGLRLNSNKRAFLKYFDVKLWKCILVYHKSTLWQE